MLGNFILVVIFIFELLFFKSSKSLKTFLVFNSIFLRIRRCLLMTCLIVFFKLIRIEILSENQVFFVRALRKWLCILLSQNYQFYVKKIILKFNFLHSVYSIYCEFYVKGLTKVDEMCYEKMLSPMCLENGENIISTDMLES